jgi:hypothetical protein
MRFTKRSSLLITAMAIALLILGSCNRQPGILAEEGNVSLRFSSDGVFRIAQFTDVHWKNDSLQQCTDTKSLILHVLETEKPDLVVLTGDIVNEPAPAGWEAVTAVFVEAGVPFAVTLGNHDDEFEWSRDQIFDYLSGLPGFVGRKGPEEITGVGNYVISLKSAKSATTAAVLYFIDSNAYCADKSISDYGWIHFDQIAWYREQSRKFTVENGGNPYPGLAFFHIPVPEYAEVQQMETTIGSIIEKVYSPEINTGMLAAFVEMGDVMGTFVGHDHDNNYIGMHKGIALAYGQASGYSGYGTIGKGSRIIELREGARGFKTWIRTSDSLMLEVKIPVPHNL